MSEKLWTRDFLGITFSNFLLMTGFEMLSTTIGLYIVEIGGTSENVGMIMLFFTAAALIMRAVSGVLLDRYGRKVVFLTGLGTMTVIMFFLGFITALGLFFAVRLLNGLSWGVTSTSVNTVASDMIPRTKFGEGMGYFALSSSLAMAFGPTIGLTIVDKAGFRPMFLFGFGMAAVSLLICAFIPMQKGEKDARMGKMIEEKAAVAAIVIMFLCFTYGSLVGFLALFAADLGISNSALFFAVYAVTLLVSRPVAGKITDTKGFMASVLPGICLMAVAMILIGTSGGMAQLLAGAAFYGVGMGAANAGLQTMAVVRSPQNRVGAANATFYIGFDGGIGIGSALAGVIAGAFGYGRMFLIFTAFVIIAGVVFVIAEGRRNPA